MSTPKPPPNPRGLTASDTQTPAASPATSLVEELGVVADDLRQLYTDFGLRPYRVLVIREEWTGGEKGRGSTRVVDSTELLPTPLVEMAPLRGDLRAAGQVTRGGPRLSQISPRYTEDQVRGMFWPEDDRFVVFVEVVIDNRDGENPVRRRFTVRDVPYRRAGRFEWRVDLTPQDDNRDRDGNVAQAVLVPGRKRR